MKETIDISIVVTVVSENTDFQGRIEAGTSIFNGSGAAKTFDILKKIRDLFPQVPIIATGGPNEQTTMSTIEAGTNAITYTPPTPAELFRVIMDRYMSEL